MRKILCAAALAAFAVLAIPISGEAQPRPAGGDCEDMVQAYAPKKLWWGRFSGGRKQRYSFSDGGVEYHTAEACFTSRQACEAWLYRLKSDWQFMPRWNECIPGYRG
jgi:hypothetical protein